MEITSDNTAHAKAQDTHQNSNEPPAVSESNQFNGITLPAMRLMMKMGHLSVEETLKKLQGVTNKSDKDKLTMVSNVRFFDPKINVEEFGKDWAKYSGKLSILKDCADNGYLLRQPFKDKMPHMRALASIAVEAGQLCGLTEEQINVFDVEQLLKITYMLVLNWKNTTNFKELKGQTILLRNR